MPMSIEWDTRREWWKTGTYRGWARNFMYKMAWRFGPTMDTEDYEQHAYYVFIRVLRSYPYIFEPPHLMSVFQIALSREVHDLSKANSNNIDQALHISDQRHDSPTPAFEQRGSINAIDIIPTEGHRDIELRAVVSELPEDLRRLLGAWCFGPTEALSTPKNKKARYKDKQTRVTNREMIANLIGGDISRDYMRELKEALYKGGVCG